MKKKDTYLLTFGTLVLRRSKRETNFEAIIYLISSQKSRPIYSHIISGAIVFSVDVHSNVPVSAEYHSNLIICQFSVDIFGLLHTLWGRKVRFESYSCQNEITRGNMQDHDRSRCYWNLLWLNRILSLTYIQLSYSSYFGLFPKNQTLFLQLSLSKYQQNIIFIQFRMQCKEKSSKYINIESLF